MGVGEPIEIETTRVRTIRGQELFIKRDGEAARIDLRSGAVDSILRASQIDDLSPYRWGGRVALSHSLERLDTNPLWGVSVWEEEKGARLLVVANEPIRVHAMGPDGSFLAQGRFFPSDGDPQAVSKERLVLFDATGRAVKEFEAGTEIRDALGGEHFALLQRVRDEGAAEELVAIDWATGDELLLVRGKAIDRWSLDHSDRRVLAIAVPHISEGSSLSIWTGVVSF